MTPKHRAHAGLAILAGIVMACSPPLAELPTPGAVTREPGTATIPAPTIAPATPTPDAPPATATPEPTATATLVPFTEHLAGAAVGLGGQFRPDMASLTSVRLADNDIRRQFNELGIAPVVDAAGQAGVEICYYDGQCAVSLAAPMEFDGLKLDPKSSRTNEMLAAYVDPATGQEAGYLVRRVVYEDAVDGVGAGTNAEAGARRDYVWGVQENAAGQPVMVLVEVADGRVRVVRPARAFFPADPNNPPEYDQGAETLYIAGQTIVRGVGAEVQKVFTAEQVREKSDAELIAAANIAVPEVIKDRVDFAGMDLEASGVFRGGVGRRYQYDFVLLKDKKTGLIAGVYQLETGKVLHAFGGEFEQDGKKGPFVLVVTDETVLEEGVYLGLSDVIGPKNNPEKQVTDKKLILDAVVKTIVAKRALVRYWAGVLSKPEIIREYGKRYNVDPSLINQSGFEGSIVSQLTNKERDMLIEEAINYYLGEGEEVVIMIAKRDEKAGWSPGEVGYYGEGLVKEDFDGWRRAYVVVAPTWRDGRGRIPTYSNKQPPGGMFMTWVSLIGGDNSLGSGYWSKFPEAGLMPSNIVPMLCGMEVDPSKRGQSLASLYAYDCAVVARQVGGGN